eukprot:1285423-Amorphochlora_amoeboformis.AAC.2
MGSRQSSASIEEKGVLGYSEKDIEIGRAVGTGYLAKLVSGKDKGAFVVVKARSTRDSKWFLKERSRLETLRHENVVGILGFIDKGDFRVLWEYCDGIPTHMNTRVWMKYIRKCMNAIVR